MKKEKIKNPNKVYQHEENSYVDVYNDDQMIELGIRPPRLIPRDSSVWTKTPNEKRLLKVVRRSTKNEIIHFHSIPRRSIPVRAKLIIYLRKNNVFPNSTYSVECSMHSIGSILSRYSEEDKNLVIRYSYNGKTYDPKERPFWR